MGAPPPARTITEALRAGALRRPAAAGRRRLLPRPPRAPGLPCARAAAAQARKRGRPARPRRASRRPGSLIRRPGRRPAWRPGARRRRPRSWPRRWRPRWRLATPPGRPLLHRRPRRLRRRRPRRLRLQAMQAACALPGARLIRLHAHRQPCWRLRQGWCPPPCRVQPRPGQLQTDNYRHPAAPGTAARALRRPAAAAPQPPRQTAAARRPAGRWALWVS